MLLVSFRQTRPAFMGHGAGEGRADPIRCAWEVTAGWLDGRGGAAGLRRPIKEYAGALFHHPM